MKILIQNGRVVDPASGRDELADVAIAAGRIVAIGRVNPEFNPARTIDASGLVVAPGLVDLAVRLREPGYTHAPEVIAQIERFFALNSALEVDLCGRMNAETVIASDGVLRTTNSFLLVVNPVADTPTAGTAGAAR